MNEINLIVYFVNKKLVSIKELNKIYFKLILKKFQYI